MEVIFIKGKVIRKIKGFYYVLEENDNILQHNTLEENNIYECRLRGALKVKNSKLNCIIGDSVEFDEKEKVITSVLERKNFLHRPLLANIDFIGILFSASSPDFDFNVFQKMLLNANSQNIPVILIISKIDLVSQEELEKLLERIGDICRNSIPVFSISSEKNIGIDELKKYIENKSVTISGPSGTGKSTLINFLMGKEVLATNEVSSKTSRGRHTTTESRFFKISCNTYVVDTPGFSSLDFPILAEKKELEGLFPEFSRYTHACRFRDCIHVNEPDCQIKEAVKNGDISEEQYNFYLHALSNIFNN